MKKDFEKEREEIRNQLNLAVRNEDWQEARDLEIKLGVYDLILNKIEFTEVYVDKKEVDYKKLFLAYAYVVSRCEGVPYAHKASHFNDVLELTDFELKYLEVLESTGENSYSQKYQELQKQKLPIQNSNGTIVQHLPSLENIDDKVISLTYIFRDSGYSVTEVKQMFISWQDLKKHDEDLAQIVYESIAVVKEDKTLPLTLEQGDYYQCKANKDFCSFTLQTLGNTVIKPPEQSLKPPFEVFSSFIIFVD